MALGQTRDAPKLILLGDAPQVAVQVGLGKRGEPWALGG